MKKIVVATKNKGKIREMLNAFENFDIELISLSEFGELPDAVEDGETFKDNALIKARFYMRLTNCACIADDSGIEVDVLGGAPGVYSARFAGLNATDEENNAKLISEIKKCDKNESPARYKCVLAYVDTDDTAIFSEGSCEGIIKFTAKGEGGFGYDPYFYISDNKTMAELTIQEKDKISHRGKALREMALSLKTLYTNIV